jgi:hypothetical protein
MVLDCVVLPPMTSMTVELLKAAPTYFYVLFLGGWGGAKTKDKVRVSTPIPKIAMSGCGDAIVRSLACKGRIISYS